MSKKIAVYASGRGSNFVAVYEAMAAGKIVDAQIVLVLTDRPGTGAEEFAASKGIPTACVDYKSFENRGDFNAKVLEQTQKVNPDLILTLGYMRILPEDLVKNYRNRIINIHPSLLPAFPGMNSQKQAFQYGVKITGATVHFIDEGVDTGPIILQAAVDVKPDDDEKSLAQRILEQEHRILAEAVAYFCADRLKIDGRRVRIL